MGLPEFIIQEFPENVRKPMVMAGNWLEANSVKNTDFSSLKSTVEELAEAQKRTEIRLEELAEAQKRTEIRLEELAEAQKRTEIRLEELAEAQKRTEIRLEELAEAQKRTETRLEELAEYMKVGFKRIDDRFSTLGGRWGIQTEQTLRNTVEALMKTAGYTVRRGYYGDREVDLVIRNGEHILLEITSSCKKSDIPKYIASAEDYEKKEKVRPKIMLAAIYVHPNVMRAIIDSPRKIEIFSSEEDD